MPLVTRPFAQLPELDELARHDRHNVSRPERTASLVVGGLLATAGVLSRSRTGLVLGLLGAGALIARGASGHCGLYRRLGLNTARPHAERGVPGNKGIRVEASENVNRPAAELYRYWRRLENLPSVMPHLLSVEETAEGISRWRVRGLLGREIEWDAEIIEDQPGRMLAWQSLPGALVASAGSVWFEAGDEGTRVKVSLQYLPPAGRLGAAVAGLLGASPHSRIRRDLARFRASMEGGE